VCSGVKPSGICSGTDQQEHGDCDFSDDQNFAEESAAAAYGNSAGSFVEQVAEFAFHGLEGRREAEGERDPEAYGAREEKREYIQFNRIQPGNTRRREADSQGNESARDQASA
jgi:hypothetical protein